MAIAAPHLAQQRNRMASSSSQPPSSHLVLPAAGSLFGSGGAHRAAVPKVGGGKEAHACTQRGGVSGAARMHAADYSPVARARRKRGLAAGRGRWAASAAWRKRYAERAPSSTVEVTLHAVHDTAPASSAAISQVRRAGRATWAHPARPFNLGRIGGGGGASAAMRAPSRLAAIARPTRWAAAARSGARAVATVHIGAGLPQVRPAPPSSRAAHR